MVVHSLEFPWIIRNIFSVPGVKEIISTFFLRFRCKWCFLCFDVLVSYCPSSFPVIFQLFGDFRSAFDIKSWNFAFSAALRLAAASFKLLKAIYDPFSIINGFGIFWAFWSLNLKILKRHFVRNMILFVSIFCIFSIWIKKYLSEGRL